MNITELLRLKGLLSQTVNGPNGLDMHNKVVAFDEDPTGITTPEGSYLFSCPPILDSIADLSKVMCPIGAVQGFQWNEAPGLVQFPEVGSKRKRAAKSSGQYSANCAQVNTRFQNLKFACYAWVPKVLGADSLDLAIAPGNPDEAVGGTAGSNKINGHWISTESEIFMVPFGLVLLEFSAGGELVTKMFFERGYIANAGSGLTAGQAMIIDNCAFTFDRIVPLWDGKRDRLVVGPQIRRSIATTFTDKFTRT